MTSIPLLLSSEHPCSYLEEAKAQSLFVYPKFPLQPQIYVQLLAQGFRRSGDEVYRPHCENCNACIPARIPVLEFKATRAQQRCLKRNLSTQVRIKPAEFEESHYQLYLRYQRSRHPDGNMADTSPDEYIDFLGSSWCDTVFVEFSIEEELVGIAVVDVFDKALSAVYTFFDPKFSHYSPGVYAVLWQIDYAKQLQKDFVYLGYWISQCSKMAYKIQYQPLQILQNEQWVVVENQ